MKIRNSFRLGIIGLIFSCLVIIFLTNYNITSKNNNKEWIDISLDYKEIEKMQSETDQGHKVGRLNPEDVAMDFVDRSLGIGILGIKKFEKSDDGNASVILSTSKGIIETTLEQPNRKDSGGIWVVKKYRWIR